MSFYSLNFGVFLVCTFFLFYVVKDHYRWVVLLIASFVFYAALKVAYLPPVLFLVIMAAYLFGIWIHRSKTESRKKIIFWGGVGINLFILIFLKYLPFLIRNVNELLHHFSPTIPTIPISRTLISIGVSFYVFQAISYLADIYLEIQAPEKHFGYLALSFSFFPKVLQGPIERANVLLPQLRKEYIFNYGDMRAGLVLFTLGLFKKVVIADHLSLFVNAVYGDVRSYSGMSLIMATYYYAFQVYFDFSGYTDMALGLARMFNIRLTNNFNAPYLATSVSDFWRRWHISFSSWILDYIFKPLQFQMRNWKNRGTAIALMITFLFSGLWHGANWNFLLWGAVHGMYLVASFYYQPLRKKAYQKLSLLRSSFKEQSEIKGHQGVRKFTGLKIWQRIITFHLICFAWILFRADTVADALYIMTHLLDGMRGYMRMVIASFTSGSQWEQIFLPVLLGQRKVEWCILLVAIGILAVITFIQHRGDPHQPFAHLPTWGRWAIYYLIVMFVLSFSVTNQQSEFIYFQF